MNSNEKLKLQKKLKHQNQIQKFYRDAEIRYKKQLAYQKKHDHIPLLIKLGYDYGINTKTINHQYDDIIAPRTKLLSNPAWVKKHMPDDKKDNRTILANLNYIKISEDHHNIYAGIAVGYRFVVTREKMDLYLLVKDVYTLVHGHYRTANNHDLDIKPHFATDHLWIALNRIDAVKSRKITIGLGDAITFAGKVKAYRGRKENIRQTKYGLKDVVILDSGYPKILPNDARLPIFNNFTWFLNSSIHYHHHDYMIEYVNSPHMPSGLTIHYGNQWQSEDRPLIDYLQSWANTPYRSQSSQEVPKG